jgi:hypothetical protein
VTYPANYFSSGGGTLANGSGSLPKDRAGGANTSPFTADLKIKSETCMMREFMAFVVTRLQMVHDLCDEHERPLEGGHKDLLAACLRLWWRHANGYL